MNTDNADSQFTPGERLVAILLLALALGALFLGASLEGYTQSLLAETGAGLILFLALGLAVPTRLPSTVLWSITFLGTLILLVGLAIPDDYPYLQSLTADFGVGTFLFLLLEKILREMWIRRIDHRLRIFQVGFWLAAVSSSHWLSPGMGFLQASSRASILLFRGTVDEELDRLDHIVPKIPLAYRLPNESIDLPYTVEAVIAAREESTQRNLVQTARELRPLIARQVIEPSTALRRLVRDAYGSAERLRSAADVLRPDPGEAQAVALLEQAAQLAENPPPPSDAGPAVAP